MLTRVKMVLILGIDMETIQIQSCLSVAEAEGRLVFLQTVPNRVVTGLILSFHHIEETDLVLLNLLLKLQNGIVMYCSRLHGYLRELRCQKMIAGGDALCLNLDITALANMHLTWTLSVRSINFFKSIYRFFSLLHLVIGQGDRSGG